MKKKFYIILGFIFLVSVAYGLLEFVSKKQALKTPITDPAEEQVVSVPFGQWPDKLPKQLPVEEGALIKKNEVRSLVKTGEVQYVRSYLSKKTVRENFELYKSFLEKGGWKITGQFKQEKSAVLQATQNGQEGVLEVNISENLSTRDITVETVMVFKDFSTQK